MNIGGNYYYVIFFKDNKIIHKGQYLTYRIFNDFDAKEISKYKGFEYDSYEADFLREQSGDEM